jgi:hypothetical protein
MSDLNIYKKVIRNKARENWSRKRMLELWKLAKYMKENKQKLESSGVGCVQQKPLDDGTLLHGLDAIVERTSCLPLNHATE